MHVALPVNMQVENRLWEDGFPEATGVIHFHCPFLSVNEHKQFVQLSPKYLWIGAQFGKCTGGKIW